MIIHDPKTPYTNELVHYATRPVRVLLAEDHPDVRCVMAECLRRFNVDLQEAASLPEADGLLKVWVPEIALVDVYLPSMEDGINLLNRLDSMSPSMGIVAMSGGMSGEMVARAAQAAGVIVCVTKPIPIDTLDYFRKLFCKFKLDLRAIPVGMAGDGM